jgi:hypothetical protein
VFFIYVFNELDSEVLINKGYHLLKVDKANGIYVFENDIDRHFDFSEVPALITDVLTF